MNVPKESPQHRHRRLIRLGGVAVLLMACCALLMPRYRADIATVDGSHRWLQSDAPTQRTIVWEPARVLSRFHDFPYPVDTSSAPFVAEHGNVVYFSMKRDKDDLDIYCARWGESRWSDPQLLQGVNSPGDEKGPVLNQAGDHLYFSSDREGGFGGNDLYVSVRKGTEWSRPINLGSSVNTPADESSVCLNKDETMLIFASNRGVSAWDPKSNLGLAMLPDDWLNHSFDLYQCDRKEGQQDWGTARSLSTYNTLRYDEITPFISSDGVFLLFASDRPSLHNSPQNFDLFRARLARPELQIERFGPEVNSLGNEFAPSLSESGFELQFFLSEQNHVAGVESLSSGLMLQSTSKEVEVSSEWDRSRLDAILALLRWSLMQFIDHFVLIVSIIAVVFAATWVARRLAARRFAVPGFLLLALLLHGLLISGSFFVFFQQSLTRRFQQLFEEESVVATQVLIEPSNDEGAQADFDQVAPLVDSPTMPVAAIAPQEFSPTNALAIELANPIQMARASSVSLKRSRENVVAHVPALIPSAVSARSIARSAPSHIEVDESIRLEATTRVQQQSITPIPTESLNIERSSERVEVAKVDVMVVSPGPTSNAPFHRENEPLNPVSHDLHEPSDRLPLAVARKRPVQEGEQDVNFRIGEPEAIVEAKPTAFAAIDAIAGDVGRIPEASMSIDLKAELPSPELKQRQISSFASPSPMEASYAEAKVPSGRHNTSVVVSRMAPKALSSAAMTEIEPERIARMEIAGEQAVAPMQVSAGHTHQPTDGVKPIEDVVAIEPPDRRLSPKITPPTTLQPVSVTLSQASDKSTRSRLAASLLSRKATSSPNYADTNISLQSLLLRRKLDDETKQAVVKEFGGNDETLTSIKRGLQWLERHQAEDGRWGLHDFNGQCKDHERCDGHGNTRSDTAATALALLPFLGDGHTHQQGAYKEVVARGVSWLVKQQRPDGNLFAGTDALAMMYSHGIATIALCECYGMTSDPSLREPSQRAVDFIVASQDPSTGGWRYQPRNGADTSVVGWQVMALKSAQMAGLNVPETSLREVRRWLESVAGKDDRIGQFAYQGSRFNPAMSAEALLCFEYLDLDRDAEMLLHSANYLQKNLPQQGHETSYYWYYGTQAMFHLQGEPWKQWNQAIHPLLIETQHKDGKLAGTWDPKDQWEISGGRIYATSLRLLMLEVYYRHLPIYQTFR